MNQLKTPPLKRVRRRSSTDSEMLRHLSARVIGQQHAMRAIVPFVQMYEAGLGPECRPAGVFLLLGPTGTGKTRTVEALAEVIHGSKRNMLRVDCGEFQMDHEVAKLTGAPPGYLGHRETHPVLTQAKLAAITSQNSSLSIVLFDEVEKAASSLTRLLLGVLDKACLRLGDNNVVNFERCLIFLTSNVGAHKMQTALLPGMGFRPEQTEPQMAIASRLEAISKNAARRSFAPEFLNRVDEIVTYQPLCTASLETILDMQLREFQEHLNDRLGARTFRVEIPAAVRRFLLERGTSLEYGAREIGRAVQKHVAQPVASLVIEGRVKPGGLVRIGIPSGEASHEIMSLPEAA
ncbi:MAG: ATP-dependent Clp protease ATP-binding subunit [Bryobacteraceae bacterium]|nr:ATP-dependent Clp protease ATP-binding subunit [Bryobacteraceae bacterium]